MNDAVKAYVAPEPLSREEVLDLANRISSGTNDSVAQLLNHESSLRAKLEEAEEKIKTELAEIRTKAIEWEKRALVAEDLVIYKSHDGASKNKWAYKYPNGEVGYFTDSVAAQWETMLNKVEEGNKLRLALIKIVLLCGGAADSNVSNEFLTHVPAEVEALKKDLENAEKKIKFLESWQISDKSLELMLERYEKRLEEHDDPYLSDACQDIRQLILSRDELLKQIEGLRLENAATTQELDFYATEAANLRSQNIRLKLEKENKNK